jgi:ABC-type transport system substrate-binding protein
MSYHWFTKPKLIILTPLLLAVACGSAAPPADTQPDAMIAPQPAAVATPTPVPQVAAEPETTTVHPGKLAVMLADLGDGRLDQALASPGGQGRNLVRLLGGFLISDNEKREMVPGIASQWDVSADGLPGPLL